MLSQHHKKALRNPWFIGILGLMAVVLGVNGTFIWLAMKNRPALVDREYSTKDRKSDSAALHDLEAHRNLAWQTTLKRPENIVTHSPASYEISVVDRAGIPVSGAMEVAAYRASDASKDFHHGLQGNFAGQLSGLYQIPAQGLLGAAYPHPTRQRIIRGQYRQIHGRSRLVR
jgi:hypothetical protein